MKDVRPTSSKVLQALFNILGSLQEVAFLDLFAGTGKVGAFAYERGARPVVEVELVRKRAEAIRKNFKKEIDSDSYIVLSMDIRRALQWLQKKNHSFDIIFADPPYEEGWPNKILDLLKEASVILRDNGLIIIEHSIREPIIIQGDDFIVTDSRTYGDTNLTFLKKKEVFE